MATIVVEVPESCKSLLEPMLALVQLVEKLSHPGRRERDFAGVEAQIGSATARVECAAVGEVLRSLDAGTDWVVFEGSKWKSLGADDKTYYGAAGPITIARKLFRKVGEHNGPTLDVVGVRAGVVGDGWLPGVASAMAHLLQQGTAREAETTGLRMGRLQYSRSSFERIGHAVGELYVERRLDIEGDLVEELVVPREAQSASVALDRVALPMEEIAIDDAGEEHVTRKWHMAYVGALTLHDGDGAALHTVRYACMPKGDIDGIAQSLQGDLLHVLAQRPKLLVVKLADGADEMRRRLDEITDGVADDASDMVDFWHAVEKFGKAAHAFAEDRIAKQLLSQWRFWLLNELDGVARVRRDLAQYHSRGIEAVDEAITYIDNQSHRMRYAEARAKGLPIGSGNVEASCKSIVRQRMCRGGSRWKHEPGENVLHLRALAQSDRWDAGIALALRPLRKKVRHAA